MMCNLASRVSEQEQDEESWMTDDVRSQDKTLWPATPMAKGQLADKYDCTPKVVSGRGRKYVDQQDTHNSHCPRKMAAAFVTSCSIMHNYV